MQTPIRKPGKYTGQKPDPCLTPAKYNELQAKLDRLKNFSQPHAIKEVKRLALDGDFSENAAYSMAKGRLRGINQRIIDIEDHLKRAVMIDTKASKDIVALGSRVSVEVNNKQKTFYILGSSETSPTAGIISHHSPLGAALMGHRVGDRVQIKINNKLREYKIIKLE